MASPGIGHILSCGRARVGFGAVWSEFDQPRLQHAVRLWGGGRVASSEYWQVTSLVGRQRCLYTVIHLGTSLDCAGGVGRPREAPRACLRRLMSRHLWHRSRGPHALRFDGSPSAVILFLHLLHERVPHTPCALARPSRLNCACTLSRPEGRTGIQVRCNICSEDAGAISSRASGVDHFACH